MVDGVKVAGQITFDDPPSSNSVCILQLGPYCPYRVMHTQLRSEAVGIAMEIALPDRLQSHQHGALNNAVYQSWNTQGPVLAIGFWNADPFDRLGAIRARQKLHPQTLRISIQITLQVLLIHSINVCRSRARLI